MGMGEGRQVVVYSRSHMGIVGREAASVVGLARSNVISLEQVRWRGTIRVVCKADRRQAVGPDGATLGPGRTRWWWWWIGSDTP